MRGLAQSSSGIEGAHDCDLDNAQSMDFTPTYERRVTAKDEGSDWLYVDPTDRSRHRVKIDVVPDRAQKIRIQHLDRDMRGRSEWVPIGRAKVPWELRDAYEATEEMW